MLKNKLKWKAEGGDEFLYFGKKPIAKLSKLDPPQYIWVTDIFHKRLCFSGPIAITLMSPSKTRIKKACKLLVEDLLNEGSRHGNA